MKFQFHYIICICIIMGLLGCNKEKKSISFYYWKTSFKLNHTEKQTLAYNNTDTLFVRYFDVEFNATDTAPHPNTVIQFKDSIKQSIIPVVYIKNSVFQKTDSSGIPKLCRQVWQLVSQVNNTSHIRINEMQFDCDWTEKTKHKYFYFLSIYKQLTQLKLSATIRLHQVKYLSTTGVPPVDYGVLMYYNMGEINSGPANSVYNKKVADKYNQYINIYPLQLDVALPIFAWGIQLRDNKVVALLNKMNASDFKDGAYFQQIKKNRYKVVSSCFKGGYYLKAGDEVKIEHIAKDDLMEMSGDITSNSRQKIRRVIFYDLDASNIEQYEKSIFKAVAGNMR